MGSTFLVAGGAIPQAPALGDHVVLHLRRAIVSGEIPPQTHLVEGKLSRDLEVSRGPIRDALRQLETEGLVQSRRRGVFAVGLRPEDVDELYSLRELLEVKAVELAQNRPEEERWEPVKEHLEKMRHCAESDDARAFAEADLAFHSAIYGVAGHGRLASVWKQYEPTFAVMLELTNAEDRDLGPTYTDHVDLYRNLRDGELSATVDMLREHLKGSHDRLRHAVTRRDPQN